MFSSLSATAFLRFPAFSTIRIHRLTYCDGLPASITRLYQGWIVVAALIDPVRDRKGYQLAVSR
ncbi:hypothetical protein [uncultured Cohaesibacter sp.]|uniref:hypothetical protein n=1 Tax=uncultured Cohaesibacter sp. TaxID=1002546 RepID=UPI0029C9319B|nr:hypothetical protein [uncultured Cohaesibacter sp.]